MPSVDPRDPSRHVEMPQALPYGLSVEGLGLRAQAPMQSMAYAPRAMAAPAPMRPGAPPPPAMGRARSSVTGAPPPPPAPEEADDEALEEEASLERSDVAKPKPEAKAKKGFIERVRGAFTGRSSPIIVWIGRVVSGSGGRVVIEIAVEGRSLAWKPAPEALALLANGTSQRYTVDATRTTRDGTYESETIVRFVLEVPADFDPSTLLHVTIGSVQVEIQ
jgi:hypothetical protein